MRKKDFPQHDCGDSTKFAGGDSFVNGGFRNWNMKAIFRKHAGEVNSAHCEAKEKYNLFIKPKASVREAIASQTTQYKAEYLARLKLSLDCIKLILHQGLAFRGHDEGKDSNKGNSENFCNGWQATLKKLIRLF
uniref:DUF4371 domain-containing protein n=1 Tax=Aegilops tauschii subsp. strangulata TaxID=200361 RepID=A0A453EQM6_AEGTS